MQAETIKQLCKDNYPVLHAPVVQPVMTVLRLQVEMLKAMLQVMPL
jgi:hypothetical protein